MHKMIYPNRLINKEAIRTLSVTGSVKGFVEVFILNLIVDFYKCN